MHFTIKNRVLSINWKDIRAIEGQEEGFEELVCQLAGQEKIKQQLHFTRIGKPDAGKECYWELNNGDIHCWQAKYFTKSLSDNQWQQVDKSVKTAIDNHPKLIKYYIAIPFDRPDGKGRGKSMLQKWKEHVSKWEKYALSKKMKVSFTYWGKHELEKRLRKRENEGLIYYFFNKTELTDSWFDKKNQESINALGGRYTPELDFDLPFMEFHSGFTRDQKFLDLINGHYEDLLKKRRRAYLSSISNKLKGKISKLDRSISVFRKTYEKVDFSGIDVIPFEAIIDELKKLDEATTEISDSLYSLQMEDESKKRERGENIDHYNRLYRNEILQLRELSSAISNFLDFLDSEICSLANAPYLILVGPAGVGKSHALADIVSQRSRNGIQSLLLLGENFSSNEIPWTQILRNQLRFNADEDVLLGALNAKAESQRSRIIVAIDALNEGNGRRVWPKNLKSFIESFKHYPWLGLIVSLRDSFEDLIAPEKKIYKSIASRIYHPGFDGLEYEASTHFFKHYGISPPGSPMLQPEFQNPLFLKLFCEGLEKKGLKKVPDGYQGISAIIENYLESIEEKLSQPDELDYDLELGLLRKAVDQILVKMEEEGEDHLHYETGEEITSNIFSGKCGSDDRKYLKRIISEGVINEDLYWRKKQHYKGIHFAYQRFQDHLIVSALLDKYFNPKDPVKSFESGPLKELLRNEEHVRYNQNILEAFSIQVPELSGKELHEVAPYLANYYSTAIAFVDGLMWRRADTVGESSLDFVNQVLVKNEGLFHRFLDMCVSMATKPGFFFNADRLHTTLHGISLSERDRWWTIWLQNQYGSHSGNTSVKRLINWAWNESPKTEIDNEPARLASVMLSWFLVSSNRYLRDASTKALVCLLQNRIPILIKVLEQFEGVNDPYVYERLYAVAYGCALRTEDLKSLVPLSHYIYKTIFEEEYVYPNILLRDYAREVIEFTLQHDLTIKLDIEKIRPPYKSDLPNDLPTIEEIDSLYKPVEKEGHYGEKKWGVTAILNSMTTEYGRGTAQYGDFGRYVFQSALKNWDVDYDGLSNYAVKRIFELGYDPDLFSDFDLRQGSGRGGGYLERIGKKYQWIVFYEVLAKVSDNRKLYDESSWGNPKKYSKYDGPWRPYVRDIDPSVVIKSTMQERYPTIVGESPWWIPTIYDKWGKDAKQWKECFEDLPSIEELIKVTDSNGVEWLNLNVNPYWEEPKKLGENDNVNGRKIRYEIGSWIIKSQELNKLLKVNHEDNPWINWLPDISNRYQVFSREYYWSPASLFFQSNSYYGGDELPVELDNRKTGESIASAQPTVIYHLWEEEYDCSKEDTIAYYKPTLLFSKGLKPSQKEGEYVNDANEVICFDPSVNEKGPACLLVRKDYVQNILKKDKLSLVWVIQGEKYILGSNYNQLPNFEHKIGGLFHLNHNEDLKGNLISFIDYNDGKKKVTVIEQP